MINDIVARLQECAALIKAYEANAMCVANTFRCKIPHVKAFFAVLTDEQNAKLFSHDEHELIRQHIPWTRVVADVSTSHCGDPIELLAFIREHRENLVLKPSDEYGGTGNAEGTTESAWDASLGKALSAVTTGGDAGWIVQERIPIRREVFLHITQQGTVESKDMLVGLRPLPFRGRPAGFPTR